MHDLMEQYFPSTAYRQLLLDLDDRCRAEALKAHSMVRDHSGLVGKRSRELEGQARFRMMEMGFQEVCQLHGGQLLVDGVIPATELAVYQPFMRFENEGKGVIFGLAAMPEPKSLPIKNKSRLAGVSVNYRLTPTLDLDGKGPKVGDIFVVLLVARDREKLGRLKELAIGVISSAYDQYLYYEPFEIYLGASLPLSDTIESGSETWIDVRLKTTPRAFLAPESPDAVGDESSNSA